MAIDPRQIVAGVLTLTMFLMLADMIKREHIDAPISHNVNHAGFSQSFDDNTDSEKNFAVSNDGTWKEGGAVLRPCWSKSILEEPEESKGFVTFSLTNGPEYHVSQITDAVVVARYLKATLVIPDIRGSQPGDWRLVTHLVPNLDHLKPLDYVARIRVRDWGTGTIRVLGTAKLKNTRYGYGKQKIILKNKNILTLIFSYK
ncbi:putative O-fucosyltransferase, plant [Helianthus debilis subsp. tardiflorus]